MFLAKHRWLILDIWRRKWLNTIMLRKYTLPLIALFFSACLAEASFLDTLKGFENCGLYVHLKGGADWHTDIDFGPRKQDYHLGGFAGASMGYYFDQFRLEAECAYKRSELEGITFNGVSGSANGNVRNVTFMFNAFGEHEFANDFFFVLGSGVGVAFNRLETSNIFGFAVPPTTPTTASRAYFAWQLMPGMMFKVSDGVYLTAGYRLFVLSKIDNIIQSITSKQVPIIHSAEAGILFKL